MCATSFIDTGIEPSNMGPPKALPGDWEQSVDNTEFSSVVGRAYTTEVFTHPAVEWRIIVNEVQEPNSFGGWGYLVHVTDTRHGDLGLVDDLETARERAVDFMAAHPN